MYSVPKVGFKFIFLLTQESVVLITQIKVVLYTEMLGILNFY